MMQHRARAGHHRRRPDLRAGGHRDLATHQADGPAHRRAAAEQEAHRECFTAAGHRTLAWRAPGLRRVALHTKFSASADGSTPRCSEVFVSVVLLVHFRMFACRRTPPEPNPTTLVQNLFFNTKTRFVFRRGPLCRVLFLRTN